MDEKTQRLKTTEKRLPFSLHSVLHYSLLVPLVLFGIRYSVFPTVIARPERI